MRNRILSLLIIGSISANIIYGQIVTNDASQALEKLFNRLVNNYSDNDRIRINDSIDFIIDGYAKSDSIFSSSFKNLRYLGQITSSDSLLKIVTWNLVLSSNPGRYFSYLIRKQEHGKGNRIYKLTSSYREVPLKTDTIYTEKEWYGALFYEIKPFYVNDNKSWILLGIDYGNPDICRKIIDVLSFTPDGSLIFGKKWFASGDKIKFRDVFEYASNGMMSLRFSSDSSIVFDHLVPFLPSQKDDRQYYGPDYSYDAYFYKDGLWRLNINVDARNKE
jgi:hypothetical protein